jgi:DNA-binding beta-propeller fold protein YncE
VIDLGSNKWVRSLSGFKKPQGVVYAAGVNKLFVASGDDGLLRVFHGTTFEPLDSIKLDSGPNRITYDPQAKLVYVGYDGKDGGKTYGEIAIVDARSDRHIGDIRVDSHPAELALDASRRRLYALLPRVNKVQVIDTTTKRVVSSWPVSSQRPGDAALDPALHRLFIGTHTPPEMVVLDTETGQEISSLVTVEGMDGVAYDSRHDRIYVSGGRGFETGAVYIYQIEDADHYKKLGQITTRPGAGTSFWSPELNRYYVGAPAHDNTEAAILVYEPES